MKTSNKQSEQLINQLLIGELAKASGATTKTIRFYEEIGLLPPAQRAKNRYRLYNVEDVKRLYFIRCARSLGFSLDELKELLALRDRGEAPCGYVFRLLKEKEAGIEEQIRQLQELQGELQQLLGWAGSLSNGGN